MQRSDRTDEAEESQRSRPSSRRSSVSLPRKNSQKKDMDKKTPSAHSAHSTPKRTARPSLDFMVTGKQIVKRADRANSLPGSYRRQSSDSTSISLPRATRISERADENQASHEPSLDEDMSLDLSQVSDFEDSISKYGKLPLATSTPKPNDNKSGFEAGQKSVPTPRPGQKSRSASLQHIQQRVERKTTTQHSVDSSRRGQQSVDLPSRRSEQSVDMPTKPSRDSTFSYSRDSLYKTSSSASPYRYGTDCSSVSPEYSQSSAELSPRAEPSPVLSSCCTHSWAERTVEGEWSSFWANYNNYPLPRPLSYDQCPTPYREHMDSSDFELAERARTRSPEGIKHISNIIRSEGLRLTPRDAQRVIHCAHLLGSVLSRAVDARARPPAPRAPRAPAPCPDNKRTLTLDLKGAAVTSAPVKTSETVTTQTDISLPNTKSAPRIFENILRQLSRSSIDEPEARKLEQNDRGQNEKIEKE